MFPSDYLQFIYLHINSEQMKQPEQPWEFRSKPAWQRLLIMVGGVLFNFLFGSVHLFNDSV